MAEKKISNYSWREQLSQFLNLKHPSNHPNSFRLTLVGVGNEMQADDAAGLLAIRALKARLGSSPDVLLLEGGLAPENFTGKIRQFNPDLVIFIDAADMGLKTGEIHWLDLEQIDGFSASSHIQPLSVLAGFITRDIGSEVKVIGIQARSVEMGEEASPEIRAAVEELSLAIFNEIKS